MIDIIIIPSLLVWKLRLRETKWLKITQLQVAELGCEPSPAWVFKREHLSKVYILVFLQYRAGENVYVDIFNCHSSQPRSGSFNQAKISQTSRSWLQSQWALGLPGPFAIKALDPLRACPLFLFDFSSIYLVSALLASLSSQASSCPLNLMTNWALLLLDPWPLSQMLFEIITSPCPCTLWGSLSHSHPLTQTLNKPIWSTSSSHAWTSSLQVGSDSSSQSKIICCILV